MSFDDALFAGSTLDGRHFNSLCFPQRSIVVIMTTPSASSFYHFRFGGTFLVLHGYGTRTSCCSAPTVQLPSVNLFKNDSDKAAGKKTLFLSRLDE